MHGRNAALIARYFPRYRSPKRAYEDTLNACVRPGAVWLDLGCGRRLSGNRDLNDDLTRRARLVVGCDRDPHLRRHGTIRDLVLCDAEALPFKQGTFDIVTASMVAEHLAHPDTVFGEVGRISRHGGTFVVFTPNRLNYAMIIAQLTPHNFHLFVKRLTFGLNTGEWRDFQDDVFPTWYRANTVRRLRALLRGAGFRESRIMRLSLAHSFGFVRPLFVLSLLFERLIDRWPLRVLKADLLAVFEKPLSTAVPGVRGDGPTPPGQSGRSDGSTVAGACRTRVRTGDAPTGSAEAAAGG